MTTTESAAMPPSLTLFFIVEPPNYQYMACYLAASIRNHMPAAVKLIGYCPEHRLAEVHPTVIETLRRLRCELRPMRTEGMFDTPYPHGNKLVACLDTRDTDYSGFMDSDMLFIADDTIESFIADGAVSAAPAASLRWAGDELWPKLYGAVGLEVPQTRIRLMRDKRKPVPPYFNSGLVVFPERWRDDAGRSFAEVWYDTARRIDAIPDLDNKRPYLDQMSLPVAMARAGLRWNELTPEHHFILGGSIRGKPLPEDRTIHLVHYRKWDVLKEIGLAPQGYDELRRQVGTGRVGRIFSQPLPEGIAPVTTTSPAQVTAPGAVPAPATVPPEEGSGHLPDPSKAGLAVVTMVKGDHAFLERWLRYYGAVAGRENLYILRHGADPDIDRMAAGANIVNIPDTGDQSGFDRRRWQALSDFTGGLTLYYNWVLCGDVDEIVAPDPATGQTLMHYLDALSAGGRPPRVISPFAIEIVHTPHSEPGALDPARPVLAQRRNFRVNTNYSKPCLTRQRIRFSIGGHGSDVAEVTLDPQLFLFHLRYMDDTLSRARLNARRDWIEAKDGPRPEGQTGGSTWWQGTAGFEALSQMTPVAEQAEFPEIVMRMREGRTRADSGNWFFTSYRSKELYRLPERFSTLF